MLLPLIGAGLAGGFIADQFQKAGERKEIKDLMRKQKMADSMLGSPTGGFGYGQPMLAD